MQPLQIDAATAKRLYPAAAAEFKAILDDSFGTDFFNEIPYKEITTFEIACRVTGEDPLDPKFHTGTDDDKAYQQLKVIVKALNPKGWIPNWDDSNQDKWGLWWYLNNPSGFRLDDAYCAYAVTGSSGGSRLCFESRDRALHAAEHFKPVYKAFLS
jgi:hypothetical protein